MEYEIQSWFTYIKGDDQQVERAGAFRSYAFDGHQSLLLVLHDTARNDAQLAA